MPNKIIALLSTKFIEVLKRSYVSILLRTTSFQRMHLKTSLRMSLGCPQDVHTRCYAMMLRDGAFSQVYLT